MSRNPFAARLIQLIRHNPWFTKRVSYIWRLLQPKYSAGAVGVVLNKNGQILLAEHAFHTEFSWGLPGGWVGRNEQPDLTVERELYEELALRVEVGPVLLVEIPFPGHFDFAYLCQTEDEVTKLSYELLNYGWFHPNELPVLSPFHRSAIHRALEVKTWLQN